MAPSVKGLPSLRGWGCACRCPWEPRSFERTYPQPRGTRTHACASASQRLMTRAGLPTAMEAAGMSCGVAFFGKSLHGQGRYAIMIEI